MLTGIRERVMYSKASNATAEVQKSQIRRHVTYLDSLLGIYSRIVLTKGINDGTREEVMTYFSEILKAYQHIDYFEDNWAKANKEESDVPYPAELYDKNSLKEVIINHRSHAERYGITFDKDMIGSYDPLYDENKVTSNRNTQNRKATTSQQENVTKKFDRGDIKMLPIFDGDIFKFHSFYLLYKQYIGDTDLAPEAKFHVLRSKVDAESQKLMDGFGAGNYTMALKTVKERFSGEVRISQQILQKSK